MLTSGIASAAESCMSIPLLRQAALTALACMILMSPASAGPVIAPGDVGLRHDIQVLADWGVIRGPVTTWPLAWDAIKSDLYRARDENLNLPVPVRATFNSVLARAERETQGGVHRIKGRAAVAAEPIIIRGFADTPREEAEISAGYEYFSDRFVVDLNVTGVSDPSDDEELRADGSLLAVRWGNTAWGVSTMDRWWGPGWDGSQILSSNARPMPAFTIDRIRTNPFKTKWLSWLGPWDASFIWGQMEEERDDSQIRSFSVSALPSSRYRRWRSVCRARRSGVGTVGHVIWKRSWDISLWATTNPDADDPVGA